MSLNNLLTVWSTIGGILLAILILLVMITVHEFGHYTAGKILKFKIDEFSIGFGPALFKHKNKKTGELFSIRALPLGGYCAFDGEIAPENKEEKKEENKEEVYEEFKQPIQEKPIEVVDEHKNAFYRKEPWKRIIVLLAGVFMNYVLALLLILISFFSFGQLLMMTYEVETPQTELQQTYSFQERDIILKAEGKDIYLTTDLMQVLNNRGEGDLVQFTVLRKGQDNKAEKVDIQVALRGDTNFKNATEMDKLWNALGIEKFKDDNGNVKINEKGEASYKIYTTDVHFGFWETIGRTFVYSGKIAGSIFQVLGELLTGKLGISAMGGPVTTITVTAQVASRGVQSFLEIAAYIGVNLAVFNLLPIPALDGCKIIFTIIEWIRKKPISPKIEAIINTIGFLFLIGFAVLVDILQWI